ncbi:DUF922 domain-containing protein [Christiangramia flava]|uniref:Uncharacterized protein n=1 Tax=Christiangramia flava JLT2011 TaxID=1229726 RepID=A0A1L7I6S7_9FLAO|nr:DUF922 domain-containing protein [Christiangramia flava]APU69310.1 hypothetical protein GRFL_2586 [Christiangramia flava JLT2011]OSS38791.1 hypothetical protein C723_2182 [Christiangramia flava JLT2011]
MIRWQYCLIAIVWFFGSSSSEAQQEKISWSQNRPITWSDFRGAPEENSPYSANVNSGIGYSWSYSTASGEPILVFEVSCSFYPELSWRKATITDADYLLEHERAHFDISELHARKLQQALENYEIGRTVRLDLRRIYQKIESERVAMQERFDKETSHSENRNKELEWQVYIDRELEKLKSFQHQ